MKIPALYLQILNLVALAAMMVVNYFSATGQINGVTTADISDANRSLLTPAGFTFSVWSVIYLMLTVTFVHLLIKVRKKEPAYINIVSRTRYLFITSCILNTGWLFSWHYQEMLLSTFIMFLLAGNLYLIYAVLYSENMINRNAGRLLSAFSVYTAWITVAFFANLAAVAVHFGWTAGINEQHYIAVIFSCALFIYALYMMFSKNDFFFAAVLAWALYGLSAAQQEYQMVSYTGDISFIICVILVSLIAAKFLLHISSGFTRLSR